MKFRTVLATTAILGAPFIAGCQNLSPDTMLETGKGAFSAATLSDAEVIQMSEQACDQMDAEAQVAEPDSAYGQRLETIADNLGDEIDGTPISYKVYLNDQPNAWAMANGCVRVYSGLMDMMNNNEIEGVLGHELGHVALGHSKSSMQTAYAASLARDAAAASSNATVAALSSSQLGDLGEKFVNAQFSQGQETAADDFSFELLGERGISRDGLVTAFEKLASLDGGEGSLLSSHPGSAERAENMRDKLDAEG